MKTKKNNFIKRKVKLFFKMIIYLFPISALANDKITDTVKIIFEAASEPPT